MLISYYIYEFFNFIALPLKIIKVTAKLLKVFNKNRVFFYKFTIMENLISKDCEITKVTTV